MIISEFAQKVVDLTSPHIFVRGGYWLGKSPFIWVECRGDLMIWESDLDAFGNSTWTPTLVFNKHEKDVKTLHKALSNLHIYSGVNTGPAMMAATAPEAIQELVNVLFAGGFSTWKSAESKPVDLRAQRKKDGVCPECAHKGEWRMMALICPLHGKFAG